MSFGAAGLLMLARKAQEAVSEVGDLADAADRAGVSAEKLQVLRYALEQTAGDATQADAGLQKFKVSVGQAANLAKGAAFDAFGALGVQLRTAGGALRDNESILDDTIAKLAAIEEPSRRAAAAAQIFGRQAGPAIAAALAEGVDSVAGNRQQMVDLGILMSNDMAKAGDDLDATFRTASRMFDTIFKKSVIGAASALKETVRQMDDVATAAEELVNNPSWETYLRFLVGDYAGALAALVGKPINQPNRAAKGDRLPATPPPDPFGDTPPAVRGQEDRADGDRPAGSGPASKTKIDDSTESLKLFNDELDTTNEGLSDAAEAGKSFVSTFLHDLKDGASFLDALGNAADRLNDRLLDMAIDQLFSAFGGVGAPMDIRPLPARAGGGPVDAFRPYLVGEQGPELFIPSRSGGIVPNGGLGGTSVTIVDQRGAKAPPIEQRRSRGPDGREHLTMIIRETVAGPDVSGDLELR